MSPMPNNQRGMTLIVGVLLLVLVTVVVLATFGTTDMNLKVIGNMQLRQEANGAASFALEQTVGTTTFITSPPTVKANPVGVDVNGNGVVDYSVQIDPYCVRVRKIPNTELDPTNATDAKCYLSSQTQNSGIFLSGSAVTTNLSLCADTWWDLAATASDPSTGVSVEVHQGVGARAQTTTADNYCSTTGVVP